MPMESLMLCASEPTTVSGKRYDTATSTPFEVLYLEQGRDTIKLFLNREVAAAIVRELESLYPELSLPLGEGDVDALAMAYAEGHEGDVATANPDDGNVPISHTSPADEAIAAALDELATSPNAAKFGPVNTPQCPATSAIDGTRCHLAIGHEGEHRDTNGWAWSSNEARITTHNDNVHVVTGVDAAILAHNANVVALVEKAMGVR